MEMKVWCNSLTTANKLGWLKYFSPWNKDKFNGLTYGGGVFWGEVQSHLNRDEFLLSFKGFMIFGRYHTAKNNCTTINMQLGFESGQVRVKPCGKESRGGNRCVNVGYGEALNVDKVVLSSFATNITVHILLSVQFYLPSLSTTLLLSYSDQHFLIDLIFN